MAASVWDEVLDTEHAVVVRTYIGQWPRTDRAPEKVLIIMVEPDEETRNRCPQCGHRGRPAEHDIKRWRTLDVHGKRTFLEADLPRIQCPQHGKVTAGVPWARHDDRFSRPFEEFAARKAAHMPWTRAAAELRITWEALANITARVAADASAGRDRLDGLRRTGIDEKSWGKGQDKYLVIVTGHDAGPVVRTGERRCQATVGAFFAGLGEERAGMLTHVSADGADWIHPVVREKAPRAQICLDAFHVVKRAGEKLDDLRRRLAGELRAAGRGDEAATLGTGIRALRKDERKLTPGQRGALAQIAVTNMHDIGGKLRRRVRRAVGREKPDVADEQAADDRVLADSDRGAPVPADPRPHLSHAGDPVGLAEELPRLGDPQPGRVTEEAAADQPVMRVVGLEEERLARGQDPELAGTAGLPEIDLRHLWPVRQEPVPVVVGHPHIRPHNRYCAPPADLACRWTYVFRSLFELLTCAVQSSFHNPRMWCLPSPQMIMNRQSLTMVHIAADRCIYRNDHGRSRDAREGERRQRLAVVVTVAKGYDLGYIWKAQGEVAGRPIGGYYINAAQAGEPPGQWWGPGARALGFTPGQIVERRPYDAVYRQIDPRTGAKLGRAHGRYPAFADHLARLKAAEPHATAERVIELEREAAQATRQPAAYTDVTISFSKSISVLHASIRENERRSRLAGDEPAAAYWAGREQQLQEILHRANRAALEYLQGWGHPYVTETAWAPPYVGHELRLARLGVFDADLGAIRADAEAAAARKVGDHDRAGRYETLAASYQALRGHYQQRAQILTQAVTDRQDWEHATARTRHLAIAADAELRRRHPGQKIELLRSAETAPASDTGREQLHPVPDGKLAETAAGVRDLAVQRQAFRVEMDERQRLTLPGEDPVWGYLCEAFPAWQASGRDAILQPPKPEITPSARILQLAAERDREAAD